MRLRDVSLADRARHGRAHGASGRAAAPRGRPRLSAPVVALVIVSHSAALADGVVELAREMGGEEVAIASAGGIEDGAIGTDAERVRLAVEGVRSP
ncbi:MAG: PTS-dependent dihydroxyacetone kinase phosphotransferase subunit DhaM, partial [Solirubrobacteraceae bacterium]